jgi:hypothetical protein
MNHLLDIIREHWSWAVSDPQEVLLINQFGNVIFSDGDGRIWRIRPEELECVQIADNHEAFTARLADSEFLADRKMDALAAIATERFGSQPNGHCFCLKLSGDPEDRYTIENVATIPLRELIRITGNAGCYLDTSDGGKVERRKASDASTAYTFWTEKMDGRRIMCKVTLKSCFRPFFWSFAIAFTILPFWIYWRTPSDGEPFDLEMILLVELGVAILFSAGLVVAYFFQHRRRVTVDTYERIVVFENFTVAESFFRIRFHRQLVVGFGDITRVKSHSYGIGTLDVYCPTGMLRVYGYMTNYEELKDLLVDISKSYG